MFTNSNVVILRGCSGSGKSTYAGKLMQLYRYDTVLSTDNFFHEDNGLYTFQPSKLGEYHSKCLRAFIDRLQKPGQSAIIIDNTNTTLEEIAPYYAVARAFHRSVMIVTVGYSSLKLGMYASRNIHSVSLGTIEKQSTRLRETRFPSYWDVSYHQVNDDSPY